MRTRFRRTAWLLVVSAAVVACFGCRSTTTAPDLEFKPPVERKVSFASPQALAAFDAPAESIYRLGKGDEIDVHVWNRPELSGKHTIGPDGRISMPVAGVVEVDTLPRSEAAARIEHALGDFYEHVDVNVSVDNYVANRILLLGRVENPGIVRFETQPTLLEALARGGTLPVLDKQATLTRCAVFRGRDRILWIDLQKLLAEGELGWNIRLQPNDLIYIPDSDDTLVYVLGEVHRPGAYRLTPAMTVMDALSQAGGPTVDAFERTIYIVRPNADEKRVISLDDILDPNPDINFALEEGDVIYVPRNGLAKVGYALEKLSAFASVLILEAVASD